MKNLLLLSYFIFLLLITFFSYLFVDPNLLYLRTVYSGFVFDNRFLTSALFAILAFVFFGFYFVFIFLFKKGEILEKDLKIAIAISFAVLFFSYPAMLSFDIFNYFATAKILFFYRENPFVMMPIEFTGDPLLLFMHAANKVALYGPFWIALTGISYSLSFGNFLIALFTFKLLAALFYLATLFIISKISKSILPVFLFGLNPLVLIETLVSGHNDIVMIFLALFSFFLLSKRKLSLSILFFVLSILIKYATLFLLPVFLFVFWKSIREKPVEWEKVFYISSFSMLLLFLLSPLREEIYPWYALWFLPFSFLVPNRKLLLYISIALSFGLLFRYVPFMLSGTHFGISPLIKILVTFVPPCLVFLCSRLFFRLR